jgi:hypothetical protein
MDRVRFGRALGYGARHAVKTVTQAAQAAAAPDPRPRSGSPTQSTPRPAPATRQTASGGEQAARGQQAVHLGRSVWKPLARFSSSLWLQVTGTFFALLAFYFGTGLWRVRAALHAAPGSPQARVFYLHVAGFALFAYFTVSSFVRASRK